jgi:hypothetical protein
MLFGLKKMSELSQDIKLIKIFMDNYTFTRQYDLMLGFTDSVLVNIDIIIIIIIIIIIVFKCDFLPYIFYLFQFVVCFLCIFMILCCLRQ